MTRYPAFVAALSVSLLSGCAGFKQVQNNFAPEGQTFTRPSVGTTATRTIGTTLIEQGRLYKVPSLKLISDYKTKWIRNMGTRAFPITFSQGTTLTKAAEYQGVPIYTGPSLGGMGKPSGQQSDITHGLGVTKDMEVEYVYAAGGVIDETKGRSINAEETYTLAKGSKSFKQEFLYSGKEDNTILFSYREFKNDLARPAFTQNVRYDLSESKTIAFKGLRLRIIEATNSSLTYKILQPF